jgi:PAS domain S-box-containing protein
VGDPAETATSNVGAVAGRPVRAPLDVFTGLDRMASRAGDVVVVTDLDRVVVVWNPPAVALYGIPEADALGQRIELLYESTIAGQDTSAIGARLLAISEGHWRGRLIDRPSLGPRRGHELHVETTLSRLDDEDGNLVGILSIKRDMASAVRSEREMTDLASLASAAEHAHARRSIAEGVLDGLMTATGATLGIVTSHDRDEPRIEGSRGLPPALHAYMERVPRRNSPLNLAVQAPGSVLAGSLASLPMYEETRSQIRAIGLEALAAVGLHRQGEYVGMLLLGFAAEAPLPAAEMLVQSASHLQLALDQSRLIEQLEARAATERRMASQQAVLESLTALSERSDEFGSLARRTTEQVGSMLGATAGAYTLLGPDGAAVDWFDWNMPATLRDRLRELALVPSTPLRRFSKGDGAFFEVYSAETILRPESLEAAVSAGWTGYAALPIVIAGQLEGILIVTFDRPMDQLGIEPAMLDTLARMASISLGNFRLRERLVASERRYRTLFESSPEPYLVETLDGLVVDANAAAGVVYGGSADALVGLPISRLTELDPERWERRRVDALEHGSVTFRSTGIRLDGTTFPEEKTVSVVELEGEQRALVLVRDLSDQERLQQELIQAQKMDAIGQLVSGVAHELNNPLAAILGFSQVIRSDPRLPADMKHHADLLVEETTRTRRIVQNLLDFAKQRPPERYATSLRPLIESILVLQSYSLGPGRIEVEVDVPDGLPLVELDRSQIQQVLVNLTQNAIHAIRARGELGLLRISAWLDEEREPARVCVSVADDGVGVDPKHVDQLFVPFFTTKPPAEGTGLGLPVSLGIIASHGGDLRYEPGPGGRGSVFTFDLPVPAGDSGGAPGGADESDAGRPGPPRSPVSTSPGPELAPDPSVGAPAPHRILVLDDERSIRLLLEKWLRGSGFEPVIAATGEEAVELVRAAPVDAILCDHRMAGMSGTDVFEAVVALRPELGGRFVFMSGDVLNAQLREFVEKRGIGLLAKPFDLDTVHRTILAILERVAAESR